MTKIYRSCARLRVFILCLPFCSHSFQTQFTGLRPRFPGLRTPIPGVTPTIPGVTHPNSRGYASLHPGLRMGRLPGASPDFRGYAHDSRGYAPQFPGLRFAPPRATYGAPSRRLTRFSGLRMGRLRRACSSELTATKIDVDIELKRFKFTSYGVGCELQAVQVHVIRWRM